MHSLQDDFSPTIIHHFFGYDRPPESRFLYADFAGGVAISSALVEHIERLSAEKKPTDFAIDPKHEVPGLKYFLQRAHAL